MSERTGSSDANSRPRPDSASHISGAELGASSSRGTSILRASALYIVASAAGPAVALALLPILTRVLTPEDYGVLGVLAATIGILGAVVGLNPNLMVTARFAVLSRAAVRALISASVPVTLIMAVTAFGVLEGVNHIWEGLQLPRWSLVLLALMAATEVFRRLGLTILQMTHRPVPYVMIQVGGSVMAGIAAVALVVGFGLDWRGKFLADAIVAILAGAALLYWLWSSGYLSLAVPAPARREFVSYSAPLALHALGFWAINAQDRYFVAAMVGLEATGLYTVAYSVGYVLNVAHTGVLTGFNPHFYEQARQGPTERRAIVRFTYGYLAMSLGGWILFVAVAWVLVPLLLGPSFGASFEFIPWVALGYTFNAARNVMTGYLYIADRTRLIATLTLCAAGLNAILNILFIHFWGALGAAIATAVTFAFIAALTTVFAVRAHDMPWKRGALEVEG